MLTSALIVTAPLLAAEPASINETIDAVERKLELGRHERLVQRKSAPGSRLTEFTTDGCSGGLSAGWEYLAARLARFREIHGDRPPWESCCVDHDHLYHAAGPRESTPVESFEARRKADLALQACVIKTGVKRMPGLSEEYDLSEQQITILYDTVADLMYRAVRVGGIPCSQLPWRWGYGWPECE